VDIGVSALVLGQQRNVQALAQQIAQSLMRRTAPSDVSCQ
jgi:hypothetical protein